MMIRVRSEAPGSEGELQLAVTERELAFMRRFAARWNTTNDSHAAPMLSVELLQPANLRKDPPMPALPDNQVIVAGYGDFPRDMLRYDGLGPATQEDAQSIDLDTQDLRAHESRRVVRLVSTRPGMAAYAPSPTRARWESFGWTVVSHDHYGQRRAQAEVAELCAALGAL